jgi:cytochrome c
MIRLMLFFGLTSLAHAAAAESSPADVERGRKIFATCAACHREASEEVPNPGPNLQGVFGRPSASVPGFRYSRALRNAKRIWNEETLFEFIGDPQAAVPGNTMPFPGLPDEAKRRDLIAFLKTLQ